MLRDWLQLWKFQDDERTVIVSGSIADEILSRQDPRLFEARLVCERYRVAGPRDPSDARSTFAPQFVRDCQHIDSRYNQATSAIRRDQEARIMAADLASVAQAGKRRP